MLPTERKFDIKRLWTIKIFGIPYIIMMLIWAVMTAMPLFLYCPVDDFMCFKMIGSLLNE